MKKKKNRNVQTPQEDVVAVKKQPNRLIIIITAIVLALAIIATAIVLIVINSNPKYTNDDINPTAEIKLTNGMTLTYQIREDLAPHASENFIYLAEIGYFNGTVIYDLDNNAGFLRMGGYLEDGGHRGDNYLANLDEGKDGRFANGYNKRIKSLDEHYKKTYDSYKFPSSNLFGYRFSSESSSLQHSTFGVLSFSYQYTATEFQFTIADTQSLTVKDKVWKITPFAEPLNDTVETLKKISEMTVDENNSFHKVEGYDFTAPLDNNKLIKIKSVNITGMNKDKWKGFDFIETFYDLENGSRRIGAGLSTWNTTKKTTGNS